MGCQEISDVAHAGHAAEVRGGGGGGGGQLTLRRVHLKRLTQARLSAPANREIHQRRLVLCSDDALRRLRIQSAARIRGPRSSGLLPV